jgi:hypothetical protein
MYHVPILFDIGVNLFQNIKFCFEIFARLECYAALIGSYRLFGTTSLSHLQGSSSQDGDDRLSRKVDNYKSTLRNIPEEQKSDLHRSGSVKSSSVLLFPHTHLLLIGVLGIVRQPNSV